MEGGNMEDYKYTPLIRARAGPGHLIVPGDNTYQVETPVRIFTLYPGEHGDSLQGELSIRQDGSDYEALSYYWGEQTDPPPLVRILDRGSVRRLTIRPNL